MTRTLESMAQDIETMRVRGAAAIARHGAEALAAFAREAPPGPLAAGFAAAKGRLLATRPTAVSLRNAVDFVERRARAADFDRAAIEAAAREFSERSRRALAEVGRAGAATIRDGGTYMTHCNSQAAVGVFRAAREAGRSFRVIASETRPWRQGLLTARDLREAGVEDVAFVVDSAFRSVILDGVDGIVVGADTIAANGDVVNKIGTSVLALVAREHGVPFHVAAESYKIDLDAATGRDVPIEERDTTEVAREADFPAGVAILNPVFDVTPAAWVRSIFTETGAVAPRDVAAVARKAWA